jgi:PASTA domain
MTSKRFHLLAAAAVLAGVFAVGAHAADSSAGTAIGPAILLPRLAPANDAFAQAVAIAGESGSVTATNAEATNEEGEPAHGIASLWYRWTAPVSGPMMFETCRASESDPASFDTGLAVYVGSSIGTLQRVAASDDACSVQSRLSFEAAAGTAYYVVVAGIEDERGAFTMHWRHLTPAANDSFSAAQSLNETSGTVQGTLLGATVQSGEPAHGPGSRASVWYAVTAAADAELIVETCGSSFDTLLAVYVGGEVGQLTQVGANDDACSGGGSRLRLSAEGGTTYRIAVAGGETTGDFVLTWLPRAANDDPTRAVRLAGARGTRNGSTAGASRGESEPEDLPGASVWFRWKAPRAAAIAFGTCTASFDTVLVVYRRLARGGLVQDAASDDGCQRGVGSLAIVHPRKGATYYVAVDGLGARTGTFTLTWGRPPAYVPCYVPDVRGETLSAARRDITRSNCRTGRVLRTRSAIVPKGLVITQFPPPGRRLRFDSAVHLEISKGRRR